MTVFPSVGIRFYTTDASFDPAPVDICDLPYENSAIVPDAHDCFSQPVDFGDISRLQVWSDSAVTAKIYDSSGSLLDTIVLSQTATMDGVDIYTTTITWTSYVTDNGTYITLENTTDYKKSEPLTQPHENVIKLVYSNNRNHSSYGNYEDCWENILHLPASLKNTTIVSNEDVFKDSRGVLTRLRRTFNKVFGLSIEHIPPYLHEMAFYALTHDNITIWQKYEKGTYDLSAEFAIQDGQQYEIQEADRYSLSTASANLIKLGDFVRRIASVDSEFGAIPPTLLDETNITTTSFDINWTDVGADFYEFQLSTDPTFATIAQSGNTTNLTTSFTGLSTCTKYYYRLRACDCSGCSAWVNNDLEHQASIHFRGADTTAVIEFDEKVSGLTVQNILSFGNNIQFKYAPVLSVPDWSIYSFQNLAQIEADILAGGNTYSLYFELDSYASGTDAVYLFRFTSSTFYLQVGCLEYTFKGASQTVSQDLYIAFDQVAQISSVTEHGSSVERYSLISAAGQNFNAFPYNELGINTQMLLETGEYIVGIHVYIVNPNTDDTTKINISYQ
jgi:hypothetical protein